MVETVAKSLDSVWHIDLSDTAGRNVTVQIIWPGESTHATALTVCCGLRPSGRRRMGDGLAPSSG